MEPTPYRRPSDYAGKYLAQWDTLSDVSKQGVCVRIRTERFLEYPQADPVAFAALCDKCREIADPAPWLPQDDTEIQARSTPADLKPRPHRVIAFVAIAVVASLVLAFVVLMIRHSQ
jgi:hypothetical protein